MSPDCPGLPTALSNAADTPRPLPISKPNSSCAKTTTIDTTCKEQTHGCANCTSCGRCEDIKGELAIAKKTIAELENEISKLKNCPAAPTEIDIAGLTGVGEQQEKALSGLQSESL